MCFWRRKKRWATRTAPDDADAFLRQQAENITIEELRAARRSGAGQHGVNGFVYPPVAPLFFVKYASHGLEEAANQQFVYDALQAMPAEQRQGVRVPKIYRVLHNGFIIMELVRGKTLKELIEAWKIAGEPGPVSWPYFAKVSQGLQLLASLSPPAGAAPGPVGGGTIRHPFFVKADFYAPMVYDSIDTLEHYLNQASLQTGLVVTLLWRKLFFPVNNQGEGADSLCIIDFSDAGFLPPEFLAYALAQPVANESLWASRSLARDFNFFDETSRFAVSEKTVKDISSVATLTLIPPHELASEDDGGEAERGPKKGREAEIATGTRSVRQTWPWRLWLQGNGMCCRVPYSHCWDTYPVIEALSLIPPIPRVDMDGPRDSDTILQ
ncbi:hypothetical protein SPI_03204 [Niveomyces insectorum RCEF 264]|uniref:Protein kinase-like domain protein n=1 Tax=Niveomyces insectorum RCEF 264 TaxID=1081102 RepID=A0A167X5L9_9HYPO|nr:hypothetical protein SPI_03204 [Niveomyces insectorum RCEF 264]